MTRDELTARYAAGERDFRDANLRGANLSGAYLTRANLGGANLSGAYLRGANLRDAHLTWANLRDADLRGANLRGANLRDADLRGANLSDANLRGADLRGADLTGALGFRFDDAPDPLALRAHVAAHIEARPELHDQAEWGDGSDDPACGTPCCVAGWACHLGGGARGREVADAALRLLHVDGLPMPDFESAATRKSILAALRATPENGAGTPENGGGS